MKYRTVQKQNNMKENNCKLVLNLIRENQEANISRAGIAKITKMSATSITRITDHLMELGLVKQAEAVSTGTVGRNAFQLQVLPDALLTAGISIDSDYVDACILDFEDRIAATDRAELENRIYEPQEVLKIARELFESVCRSAGYDTKQIKAVGISCIGNVDYQTGKVFFAPQFQWTDVELGKMAQVLFEQPVFVDNDMKSSLVGLAHRHKDIGHEDVTYLSIGMGVGSAVMYGGTLVRGTNNASGEVGHVIMEPGGRPCDCGQRGCVQTYLTKNSLIDQCREEGRAIDHVSQIYQAFRDGEEWALTFVERQADHLALLIRNLVYMYNTEYILVGGAIIFDFPELFQITEGKVGELLHANLYSGLRLKRVDEKDNSVAGAAFSAQEIYMEKVLFTDWV
ncbi:MAG: ROK family protein [Eubacteriales bacterium]|nr:ROK family protein [Eubacteriales bacterium]